MSDKEIMPTVDQLHELIRAYGYTTNNQSKELAQVIRNYLIDTGMISPTPPEAKGESVIVPAKGLMAIHDALVASDVGEAYHQLYYLVPWQDPFNPWAEWKALIPSIEQREG
jgi:hypothetical protein